MALFKIDQTSVEPVARTTFQQQGLRERQDIQSILRQNIEIVAPDAFVIAEEFSNWEDSRRSIDILAIDKNADLVVVEIKRTEDGGHMELQALRYAAMVSAITYDQIVSAHQRYMDKHGIDGDARSRIEEFLDDESPGDDFGKNVNIVLVSSDFSKEITTTVLWLNEIGTNIRCVRLIPYVLNGETLIDVQAVLPIPGTEALQVQIREKKQEERVARDSSRDFTRYDVTVAGKTYPNQNKRSTMFHLIKGVIDNGATPPQVIDAIPARTRTLFRDFEGELDSSAVQSILMAEDKGGRHPLTKRFFCEDGEPFHHGGRTFVLSNQWGTDTLPSIADLRRHFPEAGISVEPNG